MKIAVVSVLVLFCLAACAVAAECTTDLIGRNCYKSGAPILMRFTYGGNLPDWDGTIYVLSDSASSYIECGNRAYFVVSRGMGEFKKPSRDGRTTIKCWEMLEAPRGAIVEPKSDKFGCRVAYNAVVNEPFTLELDLAQYFHLEEPAMYAVYWGCSPDYNAEVEFEVIR
jgi:hypothetical protein